MKKLLLFYLVSVLSVIGFAQTIAYPATYTNYALGSCIDLTLMNPEVKGYQLDFIVDYFLTLEDAENYDNPLPVFYSYISYDQVIYARVSSNLELTDYAISEVNLNLEDLPCCPPPPPGINSYFFCDTNNNGFMTAYLPKLRTQHGYGFPSASFCDLDSQQIITTYHTSEEDAVSGINALPEIYTFSEDIDIWYKTSNTENTDTYIYLFGLEIISCSDLDTDSDGINDYDEDVNKNGLFEDDDTDDDGLKNYEDEDDDDDLILTIDEDYNANGTPLDDDTNNNNIADYLEFSVTLSTDEFTIKGFQIIENPVKNLLKLQFQNNSDEKLLSIISITGKVVYQTKSFDEYQEYDISFLPLGLYFISAKIKDDLILKIFVKK